MIVKSPSKTTALAGVQIPVVSGTERGTTVLILWVTARTVFTMYSGFVPQQPPRTAAPMPANRDMTSANWSGVTS